MNLLPNPPRHGARAVLGLALGLGLALAGATAAQADMGKYAQHNLVSDGFVAADHTDPHLINGWGVAFNPFGFVWVNAADGMVATLYDGDGNVQSLVVSIPTPSASTGGNPTGIVYNGSSGFAVTANSLTGPSRFLFATEQGVIAAWAPNVDGTHALRMIDHSGAGSSYKGLAISGDGNTQLIYATDFFNRRVEVFNSSFAQVNQGPGAFVDTGIPSNFAPFGIQAINGDIYVTYAKQNAEGDDEVAGPGLGFVSAFDPNGHFLRRVASRGRLNAPWGLALAPTGFGHARNQLLVGNFGDGHINVFNPVNGLSAGPLVDANSQPIEIEGLWGLAFGNGLVHQPVDTLFFAAGPGDEEHGLYGRIDAVP